MSTLPTTPKTVFNTIQILRGVAALMVVLFHITQGYERRGQTPVMDDFFSNGFAGVDLFFVISGFVIMHTSYSSIGKPGYFLPYIRKRLIRIYPVYWITLLIIVVGLLLLELVSKQKINYLPQTWSLMVSSIFLFPGHPNINGVTWSLSFELYYYLLFGLLLLSKRLWPIVVAVLILSGASVVNPSIGGAHFFDIFRYFFSPYNLEFALGVLAWWLIHQYRISPVLCILFVCLSVGCLLIHNVIVFEDAATRFIYYGTSSFFLLLAATGLETNGWFKPSVSNQLLTKAGDASYLIYMIHFSFLTFYGKLLTPRLTSPFQHNLAAILFACILTAVCIELHNRVEVPMVKRLNLFFKSPSPNFKNA